MESVGSCQQRRIDYSCCSFMTFDNDIANNENLKYAVTFYGLALVIRTIETTPSMRARLAYVPFGEG